VEEARQVLARLERIDELERRLLAELEALAPEAERWAAAEASIEAARAAARLIAVLDLRR
jgi:hypothetical protein